MVGSKGEMRGPGLEPLFWGLFSAGGVVASFLVPVFAALALAGGLEPGRLRAFAAGWPGKLLLLALLTLPFFHCAHRVKHVLMDLGLHGAHAVLGIVCYGGATVASIAAVVVILRI